jgi:hypothetical protein
MAMEMKDAAPRMHLARIAAIAIAVMMASGEGCHTAHQKDTGIHGGDSGAKEGPFKRRTPKTNCAYLTEPARAPSAFDPLLADPSAPSVVDAAGQGIPVVEPGASEPQLLMSGGGGDGGSYLHEQRPC